VVRIRVLFPGLLLVEGAMALGGGRTRGFEAEVSCGSDGSVGGERGISEQWSCGVLVQDVQDAIPETTDGSSW